MIVFREDWFYTLTWPQAFLILGIIGIAAWWLKS